MALLAMRNKETLPMPSICIDNHNQECLLEQFYPVDVSQSMTMRQKTIKLYHHPKLHHHHHHHPHISIHHNQWPLYVWFETQKEGATGSFWNRSKDTPEYWATTIVFPSSSFYPHLDHHSHTVTAQVPLESLLWREAKGGGQLREVRWAES